MIRILGLILLLVLSHCTRKTKYIEASNVQLTTPLINSTSLFASKSNKIETAYMNSSTSLEVIYLDRAENKTYNSKESVVLDQIGTYKLRAINPPFLPSEWIEIKVLPQGKPIKSIDWISDVSPNYFKGGSAVLNDGKSADISFHSNGWTGSNSPFRLKVKLDAPIAVDSLTLGVLYNPSAWICPRSEVQITIKDKLTVVQKEFDIAVEGNLNEQKHAFVSFDLGEKASEIQLDFIPKNLPEEHPGAGTPAWLFLDELIIY